ncbi:MAG TPA: hypothetical protein ENK57_15370, partial [Polyangiaceae bacterium]|nr:hypothetical protein [Polyangiaceae bacterium]
MLLRGVPLEQVAAVHAASAEGFDLDEVLAVEQLPKRAWFEAELSWKRRVVEREETFAAYEEALKAHQERLARRVVPIDEDVEAWVTFLRLYDDHDEPFAWLADLGLELPDLSRLSRRWTSRFEAEPRLAKKATKLAKKLEKRAAAGKAIVLDPISVGERALVPSSFAGSYEPPASHSGVAGADAPDAAVPVPVMGLDRYAALTAELRAVHESGRDGVLARFGLDEGAARDVDEAWRARLDSDDELRADFRALVRHYEGGVSRRASAGAATTPGVVPARPPSGSPLPLSPTPSRPQPPTTGAMPVVAHVEALPFHGAFPGVGRIVWSQPPPSSDAIDATGDVIPALRDEDVLPFASVTLDGTGELSTSLLGLETLPFDGPFPGAAIPPPGATFDEPHDALGLTTTLTALELDEPVLPFDDERGASEDLDETLAFELGGHDGPVSLPFDSSRPGSAPRSAPELDEPHPELGATATLTVAQLGILDDEILPFDTPVAAARESEASTLDAGLDGTAILSSLDLGLDDDAPVAGREPVPPAPPLPTLTLDQFASLQAELAVHPQRAVAIRRRYHLPDEASQRRVEEHWQERFAASPVERRVFTAKVAEFRRWL